MAKWRVLFSPSPVVELKNRYENFSKRRWKMTSLLQNHGTLT